MMPAAASLAPRRARSTVVPEIDPQNLPPRQIDLINEGRRLEGIDITLLGDRKSVV